MMRGFIICPDERLSASLRGTLSRISNFELTRIINEYPRVEELVRAVQVHAPDVVFLSLQEMEAAKTAFACMAKAAPGLQAIGVGDQLDPGILLESMRSGIREFVAHPFEFSSIMESLRHVKDRLDLHPVEHQCTNQVFSFLPSKAGVGTSTLALNVSQALAGLPDTRVILSDFDLNSGMIRFSLNLPNEHSILDAVNHAAHLDENLWSHLVAKRGNLHVLHAGALNPNIRIEPDEIHALVSFQRRNYPVLCFDLSGNLERYSLEGMRETKRIIMVCTPEYPALHLAREKAMFLRKHDLGDRIDVVVNRVPKKSVLGIAELEGVLGMPIAASFPNDYQSVSAAMASGKCIDPASLIGKQITSYAHSLVQAQAPPMPGVVKTRFLDLVSNKARILRERNAT